MNRADLNERVGTTLQQFKETDLRWTYIIDVGLVIVGFVANHFLPAGWVAWPAVLIVGILIALNESISRNGQGWPPLLVYGWVLIGMILWVLLAIAFSAIAPLLLFVGLPILTVAGVIFWRREMKHRAMVEERREAGLCIHCGCAVDSAMGACGECGRDVVRDDELRTRVQKLLANRSKDAVDRTREVLKPAPPTVAAQRKERELLAKKSRTNKATSAAKPLGQDR